MIANGVVCEPDFGVGADVDFKEGLGVGIRLGTGEALFKGLSVKFILFADVGNEDNFIVSF